MTLGAICLTLLGCATGAAPAAAAPPPNVVVIVTDDQTLESYSAETMPQTHRRLARRGASFTEAIVSTPQCCPSRAQFLTGQYAQNNKLISNRPGYPLLERKEDVLPEWLRAAGYRTIHLGKYLNGYFETVGPEVAPGWDRWKSLIGTNYRAPLWSIDGVERQDEKGYLTATLNAMAERAILANAPRRRPFYLQIDHYAPHVQIEANSEGRCSHAAVPAPLDRDRYLDAEAPRTPAFDEADVSDKPQYIRGADRLEPGKLADVDRFYGCALASLRAVDRGVRGVVSALADAGELDRTLIVFTSDNGYSFGERRMPLTKGLPYEEHLRVPLVIRPPKGRGFSRASRRGLELDAPVANVDLAPTILGLAGAEPCRDDGPCRRMDGRSLLGLLRGRDPEWTAKRAIRTSFSINFGAYARSCVWDGFRTPRRSLIEHTELPNPPASTLCEPTSVFEDYDLRSDPHQLEADGLPGAKAKRRLGRLVRCSGIRGRDPKLSGRPFCE